MTDEISAAMQDAISPTEVKTMLRDVEQRLDALSSQLDGVKAVVARLAAWEPAAAGLPMAGVAANGDVVPTTDEMQAVFDQLQEDFEETSVFVEDAPEAIVDLTEVPSDKAPFFAEEMADAEEVGLAEETSFFAEQMVNPDDVPVADDTPFLAEELPDAEEVVVADETPFFAMEPLAEPEETPATQTPDRFGWGRPDSVGGFGADEPVKDVTAPVREDSFAALTSLVDEPDAAMNPDDEAARQEVRRAVAMARGDYAADVLTEPATMPRDFWPTDSDPGPFVTPDLDPTRDEVRKAVEQARADLASGRLADMADNEPETPALSFDTSPAAEAPETEAAPEAEPARPLWTQTALEPQMQTQPRTKEESKGGGLLSRFGFRRESQPAERTADPTPAPEEAPEPVASGAGYFSAVADETDEDYAPVSPVMDEAAVTEEALKEALMAFDHRTDDAYEAEAVQEPEPPAPIAFPDVPASGNVRSMIAQVRDELGLAENAEEVDADEQASPEAVREEVRRAVEEVRSGLVELPATAADERQVDEEAARDEVRRAVEAARAEMMRGDLRAEPKPRIEMPPVSGSTRWQSNAEAEAAAQPPSIVIEDATGRVELARVYDTLNRTNTAPHASLINYSPHSVTVGIASHRNLPDAEELKNAVQAVFGRVCRVSIDGARMSVKIGDGSDLAA